MFKAVDGNGFPGLNQTGMMSKAFINALSTLQHDSQRRYRISKMLDFLDLWHYRSGFHHQHKIRLASVRFCMSCVKKIITPEIISNNSKILFLVNSKSHILHLHIFVYFYGQASQGETPHAIRYTMCFILNNTGSQKVIGTAQLIRLESMEDSAKRRQRGSGSTSGSHLTLLVEIVCWNIQQTTAARGQDSRRSRRSTQRSADNREKWDRRPLPWRQKSSLRWTAISTMSTKPEKGLNQFKSNRNKKSLDDQF